MGLGAALVAVDPTLDILFQGQSYSFEEKVYADLSCVAPGGCCINVARGLKALRQPLTLYVLVGGWSGQVAAERLFQEGIPHRSSQNPGNTRVTAMFQSSERWQMLVGPSPRIDPASLEEFLDTWFADISAHELVVVGGSVPEDVVDQVVSGLVRPLKQRHVRVVVDARGAFASAVQAEAPFAVKVNGEVVGSGSAGQSSEEWILHEISDLHHKGSDLVVCNSGEHCYAAFDGRLSKYVLERRGAPIFGRGDAFIAGLVAAMLEGRTLERAILFAASCTSAFDRPFPLGQISSRRIAEGLSRVCRVGTRGIP